MKNTKTKNSERLERFSELYNAALTAAQATMCELDTHMKQYLGDPSIDGSSEKASTVRNITYEIIESEISPDVPSPKTDAESYSEKREHNARIVERLCEAVKAKLPFESLNDLDERYTYIYGGSIWYVEWDNSPLLNGDSGSVCVHCLSPECFIPQPGVSEVECMDYCFLRFTTTKSELIRRYGVKESDLPLAECEYQYTRDGDLGDAVTVVTALWRDGDGDLCKFIFSGSLVLADVEKYYYRRASYCNSCLREESECKCENRDTSELLLPYETVKREKLGEEFEDDIVLPYYIPTAFPIVIRTNTRAAGGILGVSDCARIRPQQQAINKVESRILQKLLRAGITPVMPEDANVTLNNSVFGQVIKLRPGESVESYGKIDTTPDVSQDIAEAERLYDHAKRVIGISDALQGTDTTRAESGFARQLKINRATSRLESKRRIKYQTYARLYKLIFEHYLAFADEGVVLDAKDVYGDSHAYSFSRYDFIEPDGAGGYKYNGAYLFSVDLNDGTEYGRETLWERNLSSLVSGTLGDPKLPETLLRYWQSQQRAHYPYARENVEYFKSLISEAKTKKQDKESEKV